MPDRQAEQKIEGTEYIVKYYGFEILPTERLFWLKWHFLLFKEVIVGGTAVVIIVLLAGALRTLRQGRVCAKIFIKETRIEKAVPPTKAQ